MIGIFDSGIGGLSVYKEIVATLPNFSTIYLGDQAHAPYGTKTKLEIKKRGEIISRYLISQGAKIIVIACNTATVSVTVNHLREMYPQTLFVGVEPPIKPLAALTKTGKVAIYATPLTCKSPRLKNLINLYAKDIQVFVTSAPEWVMLVENNDLNSDNTKTLLKKYVLDHINLGVDYAGLGCTHYPFLQPALEEVTDGKIQFIDIGKPVASQVQSLIQMSQIHQTNTATHRFLTTSNNIKSLTQALENLLQIHTKVESVNI